MPAYPRSLRQIPAVALILLAACGGGSGPQPPASAEHARLPTGVVLDPAGTRVGLGSMPLAAALSPDGRHVAVLLNGYREQGLQIVDRFAGTVTQTLPQRWAFLGLAFTPAGDAIYTSGGNQDVVYRYRWDGTAATLTDSVMLADRVGRGRDYPAGLALSPDGRRIYVALNLGDSLAVVDAGAGRVVQRLPVGRYPYGVVVAPDGTVYVSIWAGDSVAVFRPDGDSLAAVGRLPAGRHPGAMLLSRDGGRLFVASSTTDRIAVLDTRTGKVLTTLDDSAPAGPDEGSTPNALALSPDGTKLLVAEADNNAVAVFSLSTASAGRPAAAVDTLLGRVPVEWYPTALITAGDTILVANGKGDGTAPNPDRAQPGHRLQNPRDYTLGQTSGSLTTVLLGPRRLGQLPGYSARVARANGWDRPLEPARRYPPLEHVIYIIKENRTYDQVLGDLPLGDGDSSLTFFPRSNSPNHHALAERFGVFDRFFVNAEVSADGHNWSTAAYAPDYVEKTVPSQYRGDARDYDYEGANRNAIPSDPDDDVNSPSTGYLWDLARRAGITFRNYGEFVVDDTTGGTLHYTATKPWLDRHTNHEAPGWDLDVPDQRRADVWIAEFQQFVRAGRMPQLEIIRLPNDHTSGARAGKPTPQAYMADNDLALGRIIDTLSHSPFWPSTVVFVLEDDAQDGPDHVDSHRSPLLVISPWSRGGVIHRFANTTDVIATIAGILHLGSLSQFDHYGRPLRDIWAAEPDRTPYTALVPAVPLDQMNPAGTALARDSRRLDLSQEDRADEELFNRILWRAIKGTDVPYPGPRRMSLAEMRR